MTSSSSPLHATLVVLTIITSILVRVSPAPDFYGIHKRQSTGEVALLPVVLLFTNCWMLSMYGCLASNIFPLFAVSAFGVCTGLLFIGVFYRWSDDRVPIYRVCAISLVVVLLASSYMIIALTTTATHQSYHDVTVTVGWISIGTSIGLFSSPLATIKKVIQTKSAASLPFTMCIVTTVNCLIWVALACIDPDIFVMIPNAAGSILGIVQVTLWFIYCPHQPRAVQSVSITVGDLEMPLSTESPGLKSPMLGSQCQSTEHNSEINLNFAALRSPRNYM